MAGACGGLECDEEGVDRNDEDVSLDAREPTIAYDAGAGRPGDGGDHVLDPSGRLIALVRYAWVRPAGLEDSRDRASTAESGPLGFMFAVP